MRSIPFSLPRLILYVAAVCLAGTGFKLIGQDTAQKPAPQKTPAPGVKTAEQQFKNIKILKGIPADQLIPSMQFISASDRKSVV